MVHSITTHPLDRAIEMWGVETAKVVVTMENIASEILTAEAKVMVIVVAAAKVV